MEDRINELGIIVVVISVMVVIPMVSIVIADTECTSQDCPVNTSLTVGNSAPTITDVESGIVITLTGDSSTPVNVSFNVTDANGFGDLNDSTSQCVGFKTGESDRTSTSCTAQDQSGNDLTYNCAVNFQFFDAAAADWRWNCSVSDNSLASDFNDTVTFTVNALNFIDQNATTFTWFNAITNVTDQEANSSIRLDNGGNQDYETANVTAHNATDGSNFILATAFALNFESGNATGTQMAEGSPVEISSWFTLQHGDGANETLYAYVDMPAVPSGSYSSTSNWLVDITA